MMFLGSSCGRCLLLLMIPTLIITAAQLHWLWESSGLALISVLNKPGHAGTAGQIFAQSASKRGKNRNDPKPMIEALPDWREFRAGLAGGTWGAPIAGKGGWIHSTPVIEVGTLLLAAAGAFALTRPELHKAVALVLQHDESSQGKSVAVILNRRDLMGKRPSFGGPGGCRRRLLWMTSRSSCQAELVLPDLLVLKDDSLLDSESEDVQLCDIVGELSWQPGELQASVDRGEWTAAAANTQAIARAVGNSTDIVSSAIGQQPQPQLLDCSPPSDTNCWKSLMEQLSPPPCADSSGGSSNSKSSSSVHGIRATASTTSTLRSSDTDNDATSPSHTALHSVGDELLALWEQRHWASKALETLGDMPQSEAVDLFQQKLGSGIDLEDLDRPDVGSLIVMGASGFEAGTQQFLHKAILLTIATNADDVLAVCINRPIGGFRSKPAAMRRANINTPPPVGRGVFRGSGLHSITTASAGRSMAGWSRSSSSSNASQHVEDSTVVHFGGSSERDRWTCFVASGAHSPLTASGEELQAQSLGESGVWRCLDAEAAWRHLRDAVSSRVTPPNLFARGTVRLGRLELELLQRKGQAGIVSNWTDELRDVVSKSLSYRGPSGTGIRLGLYGQHHGFGLWEEALSHAFHGGVDHAATAVRGVLGDRCLREWSLRQNELGTPLN
eukprot:TRINITY_DN4281_c0_g1_i2.p1 TRINITY_DN4281_c0_g1~~TRINITY_DN4281_c0_g1_i2.p1  ORF type:complete len:671 (+),score=112.70 TRINITY_DN4281_c0_g1_i2:22-2034(+)